MEDMREIRSDVVLTLDKERRILQSIKDQIESRPDAGRTLNYSKRECEENCLRLERIIATLDRGLSDAQGS